MVIDEEMLENHNFDVPDLKDTIVEAWKERDEAREAARELLKQVHDTLGIVFFVRKYPWLMRLPGGSE